MNINWFKKKFKEEVYGIKTRTRQYLAPPFAFMFPELEKRINIYKVVCVALCQFSDLHLMQSSPRIAVLLNLSRSSADSFLQDLKYFSDHNLYLYDIPYGDLIYDKLHLIAFSYPEKYWKDYHYFLEGKYSKMFRQDRDLMYKPDSNALKVIKKDPKLVQKFMEQWGYVIEDTKKFEIDQTPVISEETFDHPNFNPNNYYSLVNQRQEFTWLNQV